MELIPEPYSLAELTPPQNVELEMCVLGAVMLEPQEAYPLAADLLAPESFYLDGHNLLFRLMGELYGRGIMPGAIAVIDELRARGKLEAVGGGGVVLGMLNSVPTAANVEYHARQVAGKARLRELIEACQLIVRQAYRQEDDPEEIGAQAERRILGLNASRLPGQAAWLEQQLPAEWQEFQERRERMERVKAEGGKLDQLMPGLPSGLLDLDSLTGGLQPGQLIIIAARPGVGKSALALNILEHLAVRQGIPAGLVSIEMAPQEHFRRLLSSGTHDELPLRGVSTTRLKRPVDITPQEQQALERTYRRLQQAPLQIVQPGGSLSEIRRELRRMANHDKVRIVAIDYLQLMSDPGQQNRTQELGSITRTLKTLAAELRMPVLLLSQLTRLPARENRKPQLSDLRESGSIEQDADIVLFIHRQGECWVSKVGADGKRELPGAELIIAKQRNGGTGPVEVLFYPEVTRFLNKVRPQYRDSSPPVLAFNPAQGKRVRCDETGGG